MVEVIAFASNRLRNESTGTTVRFNEFRRLFPSRDPTESSLLATFRLRILSQLVGQTVCYLLIQIVPISFRDFSNLVGSISAFNLLKCADVLLQQRSVECSLRRSHNDSSSLP